MRPYTMIMITITNTTINEVTESGSRFNSNPEP